MDCNISNQQSFPLETYGDICRYIGLNWPMAEELFGAGFLSYEPTHDAYPEDEALNELMFIGSIIATGCTLDTLHFVTRSLHKPYSYSHKDIYFDWSSGQWLDKPRQDEPWEVALAHIGELAASQDIDSLKELKNHVEEAINELRMNK